MFPLPLADFLSFSENKFGGFAPPWYNKKHSKEAAVALYVTSFLCFFPSLDPLVTTTTPSGGNNHSEFQVIFFRKYLLWFLSTRHKHLKPLDKNFENKIIKFQVLFFYRFCWNSPQKKSFHWFERKNCMLDGYIRGLISFWLFRIFLCWMLPLCLVLGVLVFSLFFNLFSTAWELVLGQPLFLYRSDKTNRGNKIVGKHKLFFVLKMSKIGKKNNGW